MASGKERFKHSREALRVFLASQPERDRLWQNAETEDDVFAAEKAESDAAMKVKEAFALDTADVNSRDRALLVSVQDVLEMIKKADDAPFDLWIEKEKP